MPYNQSLTLYPGNSQTLRLDGLYSAATDVFPTSATVTASLLDSQGDAVPGLDALPMTYVAGTPSSYSVVIDGSQFNPAPGSYTMRISATVGTALLEFAIPTTVMPREG